MKFKIICVIFIVFSLGLSLIAPCFGADYYSQYVISGYPYGVDTNTLFVSVNPEEQWSGLIDTPLKTVGVYCFVTQNNTTVALGIDTTVGWSSSSSRIGKDLKVDYTFKGAWIDVPSIGSFSPKDFRLIFYSKNLPTYGLTVYVDDVERTLTTGTLVAHTYTQYKKLDPTSTTGWDVDSTGDFIVYKGYAPNGNYYETDTTNLNTSLYGFTMWIPWTSRYQTHTVTFRWNDVFPSSIGSYSIPSNATTVVDLITTCIQGLYVFVYPLLTCTGLMLFGLAIRHIYSHG